MSVASETGVILDTIYTGKAVLGMLSEMRVNPDRFRGNRILFINTGLGHSCLFFYSCPSVAGGISNAFSGILDDVIQTTPSSTRIRGCGES